MIIIQIKLWGNHPPHSCLELTSISRKLRSDSRALINCPSRGDTQLLRFMSCPNKPEIAILICSKKWTPSLSERTSNWRDNYRGISCRVQLELFARLKKLRRRLVTIRISSEESCRARPDSPEILSVKQGCCRVRKYLWRVVWRYLTTTNNTKYLRKCLHSQIWEKQLIDFSEIIAIAMLCWKLCLNVYSALNSWRITKNFKIWSNCTKFPSFIRKLLRVCFEI